MSFYKTWHNPVGELCHKMIKCYLLFSNVEEAEAFVDSQNVVKGFIPEKFDKKNFEKWTPYYTRKMEFDKE